METVNGECMHMIGLLSYMICLSYYSEERILPWVQLLNKDFVASNSIYLERDKMNTNPTVNVQSIYRFMDKSVKLPSEIYEEMINTKKESLHVQYELNNSTNIFEMVSKQHKMILHEYQEIKYSHDSYESCTTKANNNIVSIVTKTPKTYNQPS